MKKYMLTAGILILLTGLCACTGRQKVVIGASGINVETATVQRKTASEQKLLFSVVEAETPGYSVTVSKEELGGNTNADISYLGLTEVKVTCNGETVPLAAAIREGTLTIPEVFAFARMDAQNGFCEETYQSEQGLTHFTYVYPECELNMAYDVYETPDGKQHLIEDVSIYSVPDTSIYHSIDHVYVDEQSEWGYMLDREDWGIDITAASVSPVQITLDYTQQQKQEVGDLIIEDFMLFRRTPDGGSELLADSWKDTEQLPIPIQSDGSGQITIDFRDHAGILEPGEYAIQITVLDNYDKADVHPLIVKYHDKQSYWIPFCIA